MSIKTNLGWSSLPNRAGGILLHPTSLPGEFGIGELSKHAYRFIDLLSNNKIKLWQILPLGPTGYGDSPYSCFSAFAGNPLLISIQNLIEQNLVNPERVNPFKELPQKRIDFGKLIPLKWNLLMHSYSNFLNGDYEELKADFILFKEKNQFWLEDFAIFMSIKDSMNGASWIRWHKKFRQKSNKNISRWKKENNNKIEFQKYVQFLFYCQWSDLRGYARGKGIYIIGDLPIYVAHDSVDVWANKKFFMLDKKGNPTYVSGVPPDEYTDIGQRWGNPLYRWDYLRKNKYSWWIERLKFAFAQVDIVRIDHFRGFEAYWKIPAFETTAISGEWIKGPREDFFKIIEKELGKVPLIAEDLGYMTQSVQDLREKFGYPGMKILQFDYLEMFDEQFRFLPKKNITNTVAYTGTHDNQTILSWYNSLSKTLQKQINEKLQTDSPTEDINSQFINFLWSFSSKYSIIPMQDLLRLDDKSRLNIPGKESKNWDWRFSWDEVDQAYLDEIRDFNDIYQR